MDFSTLLSVGFLLGLVHALEADHVIAVSTIVSREQGLWRSAAIGVVWGLGHTSALLAVGVLVLSLSLTIPAGLEISFEMAVGAVLVLLGVGVLRDYQRHRVHVHTHEHSGDDHTHFHAHQQGPTHDHPHPVRRHGRSFAVGMLHGLAGSGALLVFVMVKIQSVVGGLLYLLTLGLGSVLGMVCLSTLIGLSFLSLSRMGRLASPLRLATGFASIAVGLWMVGSILVIQGLIARV